MKRLLVVFAVASGCYDPNLVEGGFQCLETDTRCPSGFVCDPCTLRCVFTVHACDGPFASELGPAPGADLAVAGSAPRGVFWISSGGGTSMSTGGDSLSLSLCGGDVAGTVAGDGQSISFGYFSTTIY